MPRKTTREKLYSRTEPTFTTDKRTGRSMVVPTGRMVERIVRRIPAGHVLSVGRLRRMLAEEAGTETACPLVTGIMLRLLSELEEEEEQPGRAAPWWRVVRDDGKLNPKFRGYPELQAQRLSEEGVKLVAQSRSPKVDLESHEMP